MENELDKLIQQFLSSPRETHRTVIKKFKNKILDSEDFAQSLEKELGFIPEKGTIQPFAGYNPKKEIDALICNYDKRGWLYIEIPTRELFFIDASKYPYPQKLLAHKILMHKLHEWSISAGIIIIFILAIILIAIFA